MKYRTFESAVKKASLDYLECFLTLILRAICIIEVYVLVKEPFVFGWYHV